MDAVTKEIDTLMAQASVAAGYGNYVLAYRLSEKIRFLRRDAMKPRGSLGMGTSRVQPDADRGRD